MKRYKLIKEYPGSPSLGHIWNEITAKGQGLERIDLEPEFWEEIVEKDYEILSFQNTSNEVFFNRCPNGTFSSLRSNTGINKEDFYLNKGHFVIHSIKRLSDGEVFTLGDKVVFIAELERMNFTSEIGEFKIEDNTILVKNIGCLVSSLRNIKKAKKLLFTTEDGVDIYKGDKYYKILPKYRFAIHKLTASIVDVSPNWCFSSKEKAEEYILMNKPCLSIVEVIKHYNLCAVCARGVFEHTLKEKVKCKL